MDAEALGELIRDVMRAGAGTVEDLASDAGLSYAALNSWVTGRRTPSAASLLRLADAVKLRCETLRELEDRLRGAAARL